MLLTEAGLNKKTATALAKKNIYTVNDFLNYKPRKYKDYTKVVTLKEAIVDDFNAIKGYFMTASTEGKFGADLRWTAQIMDEESGTVFKIFLFGDIHMKKIWERYVNQHIVVCGKLQDRGQWGYQIIPDTVDLEENFKPHIKPIYRKIKGAGEDTLRKFRADLLKNVKDPLEDEVLKQAVACDYRNALYKIHYPKTKDDLKIARGRLLLNDLLYFSYKMQDSVPNKNDGFKMPNRAAIDEYVKNLPFALSADQTEIIEKAINNAINGKRNNLLIEGDVGCGKTVVAFSLMIQAMSNGYQAVLTAPTQVLAEQHYVELSESMAKWGHKVAFLHSGLKTKERRDLLKEIKEGRINIIVGTHSVFSKDVEYYSLGLIITDEEHKFGVKQKEALKEKANDGIHVISMSATPIPRTLAGVYFGDDKDICVIKTMPNGRIPIKTILQKGHTTNVFPFMKKEIEAGHQCYVVCPAIDDNSDDTDESIKIVNIETTLKEYEDYFNPLGIKIGVVHGKLSKDEVSEVIEQFKNNKVQILMSTTVIEVGVNVPNSTVMVVEQADRFGLASLHQLRGRVGRNSLQSYCILISENALSNERLLTMRDYSSGFDIAEKDLELRGAGELLGTKQAGSDYLLEEVIKYPKAYAKAKEISEMCIAKGFAKDLISLYEEHEACEVS